MPIFYAVVARGSVVLAKYASCAGNFAEVTEQILAKITEDSKLTYSHGKFRFHYVCQAGITYLCITDDDFERSKSFGFLSEIQRRFAATYGQRAQSAMAYAMNSDFSEVLASEMRAFSDQKSRDKVASVRTQVEDLKTIMVQNIDSIAERGEKLELLIDRTENLQAGSVSFKTTSRSLARHMCMKNMKITIACLLVTGILIFIIVTASCGGFRYPKCQ